MVYDLEQMAVQPADLPCLQTPTPEPIFYVSEQKKGLWRMFRVQCAASLILLLLIFVIHLWWPQGASAVKDFLVTEEIGPLEQAGQALVKEVFSGEPLPEAIAVFCEEALYALP